MCSPQVIQRGLNGSGVFKIEQPPAPAGVKRVDLPAVDDINIGFAFCRKPGIEFRRNHLHRTDTDVFGKQTVHRLEDFPVGNIPPFGGTERRDHSQSVHPGIGTAAPLNTDRDIAEKASQALFDHLLHGNPVRLRLPAAVIRTVERNLHLERKLSVVHVSPGS